MGLVQGTPGVTLSNVTLPIMFYWINISKIPPLNYIFSILFTHTHTHTHTKFLTNWMLFTIQFRKPSFMHNVKYKSLKFKNLIADIVNDLK